MDGPGVHDGDALVGLGARGRKRNLGWTASDAGEVEVARCRGWLVICPCGGFRHRGRRGRECG